jgi:beta-mannosidase
MDLNGVDVWTVMNANSSIKIPATVPGQVHLDLLKAKIIGDPYYRFNDEYQTWVAMDNWTYYSTFDWSQPSKTVWLVCNGLDTVANIRQVAE